MTQEELQAILLIMEHHQVQTFDDVKELTQLSARLNRHLDKDSPSKTGIRVVYRRPPEQRELLPVEGHPAGE